MIEQYDKNMEVMNMVCDECTSNEHFDGSWQDCINAAKQAGWIVKKLLEEWFHFCGTTCRDRYMTRHQRRPV